MYACLLHMPCTRQGSAKSDSTKDIMHKDVSSLQTLNSEQLGSICACSALRLLLFKAFWACLAQGAAKYTITSEVPPLLCKAAAGDLFHSH